jgi:hypothetical protein
VPAGLWLTVGLLAADGFALQLRLRKAEKVGGSWYGTIDIGAVLHLNLIVWQPSAIGPLSGVALHLCLRKPCLQAEKRRIQ